MKCVVLMQSSLSPFPSLPQEGIWGKGEGARVKKVTIRSSVLRRECRQKQLAGYDGVIRRAKKNLEICM